MHAYTCIHTYMHAHTHTVAVKRTVTFPSHCYGVRTRSIYHPINGLFPSTSHSIHTLLFRTARIRICIALHPLQNCWSIINELLGFPSLSLRFIEISAGPSDEQGLSVKFPSPLTIKEALGFFSSLTPATSAQSTFWKLSAGVLDRSDKNCWSIRSVENPRKVF